MDDSSNGIEDDGIVSDKAVKMSEKICNRKSLIKLINRSKSWFKITSIQF